MQIDFDPNTERGEVLQMLQWKDRLSSMEELYNQIRSHMKHEEPNQEKAYELLDQCKGLFYDLVFGAE